jgi:hypothetical protein
MPCLARIILAFALQLRKKHGKTSVRVVVVIVIVVVLLLLFLFYDDWLTDITTYIQYVRLYLL